jgi:hypothetical protein
MAAARIIAAGDPVPLSQYVRRCKLRRRIVILADFYLFVTGVNTLAMAFN